MNRIDLRPKPRIVVIALRRLGDVLLTTPLIRSIRRAWPDAVIDALVFADTAEILQGNPDLNAVIAMPDSPTFVQSAWLALRLWRKYDLAVSTQSGDRPFIYAMIAGKRRAAAVEDNANGALKQRLLHRSTRHSHGLHRVEEILRLADLLGVARVPDVVTPQPRVADVPDGDYAVIHASPMFRYKQWSKDGWRSVAGNLAARGLRIVATGGPAESERKYLDEVWKDTSVLRLDGKLDWPQLSGVLSKACVYVGPDTSVTHLAAAAGCPTVALYGPTDPRLWGPWPTGGLDVPWNAAGQIQHRGNVWLVQNPLPCMPCQLEGCERRRESYSACLDALVPTQVIAAVDQALAR